MTTNAVVTMNPFGASAPAGNVTMPATSAAASDASRAVAEVQAALMIARMNPRDQRSSMDRILNACTRPSLAESAIYSYARGGTAITGPSIRLAEAVAQQWGNVQFGIRELSNKAETSEVQAYAWDVETNTRREITFSVPHIRYTKQRGGYKLEDPRDIYELVANQGSRRLRACILAVIPGDVIEAAVKQCNETIKASADVSPEGIRKMIDTFDAFGVTQAQIEAFCQCRAEAIRPAQVIRLRGIYTSLKDGMSSPSDWFEPEPAKKEPAKIESKPSSLKEKIRAKQAKEVVEEAKPAAPQSPAPKKELPDLNPDEPDVVEP